MSEPLPDFHNGRALAEMSRRKSYFVEDAEAMGSFKVLNKARDSLSVLLQSYISAKELGLESFMPTVLSERSVDIERTLLDRKERESLESMIREFVIRISPFVCAEETGYILEYVCSRYEAFSFCAEEILRAVAPFHLISPRLVQAAHAAGVACPQSWSFVTKMEVVSRVTIARQCVSEDLAETLIEIALTAAKLEVEMIENNEKLFQPHYQLVTGALVRAFELTRGRDDAIKKLMRQVLPGISKMLSKKNCPDIRVAAYCIIMSLAANASPSIQTRSVLASDILQGLLFKYPASAARGLACVALLLKHDFSIEFNAELGNKVRELPESLVWLYDKSANDNSFSLALKILLPRLALHAVTSSHDIEANSLLDIVCASAPELACSAEVINKGEYDETARCRLQKLVIAALRRDPQCIRFTEKTNWLFHGTTERPVEIIAARILSQPVSQLDVTPEEAQHPVVRSALEQVAVEQVEAKEARTLLAHVDNDWALRLVENAKDSLEATSAALQVLAPHVTKLQELIPFVARAKMVNIDASSFDFKRAPKDLQDLASSILDGVPRPISSQLATELSNLNSSALLKALLRCLTLSALETPTATALAAQVAALLESQEDLSALNACLQVADPNACSRVVLLATLGTNYLSEEEDENLLNIPATVFDFFRRGCPDEDAVAYALAAKPSLALHRLINSRNEEISPKYIPFFVMAAGEADVYTRKLAIAALRQCQSESATASLALALASDVCADADALAASVRACLDDTHLELLRDCLNELSTPTQQLLAAKLIRNVYGKGGNHSALVAAWRRPVTGSSDDVRTVLGVALARLLKNELNENKIAIGVKKKTVRGAMNQKTATLSSMNQEIESILVALLKSRFAASEDGTQVSIDGDAALAALAALRGSSHLSVTVQEIALDALARRVKVPNDDEATIPLFAAVLSVLRGEQASRTKALAAIRGLDASEVVFARAWTGALKRRPKDVTGLLSDCSALLDAMAATRERPGVTFSAVCCKSMLAALTRLAPLEKEELASYTRCQLLYEIAALQTNKQKTLVTESELALVLEISERSLERDAAIEAIGTLFQLANKRVVLSHWRSAVQAIHRSSNHSVESTLTMILAAVVDAGVRLADFVKQAVVPSIIQPLASAIDTTSVFPDGPGIAVVVLFLLLSNDYGNIETELARDEKQLDALIILCRAIRCILVEEEFTPHALILRCRASEITLGDLADSPVKLRRIVNDLCRLLTRQLGALQRHSGLSLIEADRKKLALCHELALCYSVSSEFSQDEDDDDIRVSINRALRRGYRLLESPQAFVALSQHLLDSENRTLHDIVIAAMHERLASTKLFMNEEKEEQNALKVPHTPLTKLLLDELLPYLISAVIPASCDERDAIRAVSAARTADILARQLASRAPEPFSGLVEAAATAACLAARAGIHNRLRAALGLLSTLFATMRHRTLDLLAKTLPRALDALRSALAHSKIDAAETLLVLVASVPKYLHTHLEDILEILILLEEDDQNVQISNEYVWHVANDDDDDDGMNEARIIARRAARALATGMEPRILLPAWYEAFIRAKENHSSRPAAVLRLMAAAVDSLGRRAARSHAATLGAFALQAILFGRCANDARLESYAVDLIMRLSLKLTESELVEWLRAAAKWGLSGDSIRKTAFFLLATTITARLKDIVAKHVASIALEPAIDTIRSLSSTISSNTSKKKKRKITHASLDLLCCRAVACISSIMHYGGSTVLDTDVFESAHPALVDLVLLVQSETPQAIVHDLLAPCLAFLAAAANSNDSEAIHRALNARLMLHARDATLPARLAALTITKAIVTAIGSDVAYFANQMVQAIAECLEDPHTSILARDIVLLVDRYAGIRIV
mmetsp:Transcript_2601/g.4136  ORF Transcript_2601/g.4136 Transcript_2601/m.4136 type:complete len:1867 (+) Transcript_2601:59-5659(+)